MRLTHLRIPDGVIVTDAIDWIQYMRQEMFDEIRLHVRDHRREPLQHG